MTSNNETVNGIDAVPPTLPQSTSPAQPLVVPSPLDDLQKQLAKFGREQFKLNTLVETQQKQMQAALQQLSENEIRRERERTEWLTQRTDEQAHERLKLIERMLPTLDGLDEAIATLDRAAQTKRPNWWQRLRGAGISAPEAVAAWCSGLVIVRERLLNLLAEEDVYPIESIGAQFDPERHIALQHTPATRDCPAGTIMREVRRGYAVGQSPLRYAEVVVARD